MKLCEGCLNTRDQRIQSRIDARRLSPEIVESERDLSRRSVAAGPGVSVCSVVCIIVILLTMCAFCKGKILRAEDLDVDRR